MIEPKPLVPLPDPLPGLLRLRRRLADRTALRDDLLARLAAIPRTDAPPTGGVLAGVLDIAGDPTLVTLAELWSRVADGVGAYTELAAGELYLRTAQEWTDLRRVVDLVGHRPAQRTAAHGFIRAEIAPGTSPMLPARTQVQAPGTPQHDAQTYEVAVDTQLRTEWHGLTLTAVPVPKAPPGNQIRFLVDPGFQPPDRVVLVSEGAAAPFPMAWQEWLAWMIALMTGTPFYGSTGQAVRGIARVTKRASDLGATLLDFDRSLAPLLPQAAETSYAAYRLRAELTLAHRLDTLAYVSGDAAKTVTAPYPASEQAQPWDTNSVLVTDASQVSIGQTLILYAGSGGCMVTTVDSITPMDRHVAPGTIKRVARIGLAHPLLNSLRTAGLTVLLTDDRHVAQHYELPDLTPAGTTARLHPRLAQLPQRLAVQTVGPDGRIGWELTGCTTSALDASDDPGGQLISLTDPRTGTISRGAASGNIAAIRHGATKREELTLNTPAATAGSPSLGGATAIITGPVTGDLSADGTVTSSLVIDVAGVRYDEVPSLYGRAPADLVYTTRLAADGRLVVTFGNGVAGALPRGGVTATWRTGGGLGGEITSAEINTLVSSVNGIRKIAGVGALTGAADQEDSHRMQRAAGARIRALDRAVGLADLSDLALNVPGTTHSVAWRGSGPPGCPCGRSGLHVAVLRMTAHGVRPPVPAELLALSGFLDARRDTTIPLCICAAVSSAITIKATVLGDPRRLAATIAADVEATLLNDAGPLAALPRELGVPLDGSDVIAVAQPVNGVLGITGLELTGGLTAPTQGDLSLGRLPAEPYELLYAGAVTLGVQTG
ncbi:hypothetical protein ONA91_32640 [Micromonospora sp. DR5-3]|uniref:hypothetical protein n=1 Tax=unclassified Micromonospora TaxID=2617518 RepID=UPI0011D6157A|nr:MULTISPECIES: hypothetical protein [unclassified Micromonospora]MCW3819200.1 hypothetical protein [Micromonospora sp. DR5-3]TYC20730.1 hypothetical protein FXF52_29665 [Micromonospora sp. MP36]